MIAGSEMQLAVPTPLGRDGTFWAFPQMDVETSIRLTAINLRVRYVYLRDVFLTASRSRLFLLSVPGQTLFNYGFLHLPQSQIHRGRSVQDVRRVGLPPRGRRQRLRQATTGPEVAPRDRGEGRRLHGESSS